jgi:hypothetical protein
MKSTIALILAAALLAACASPEVWRRPGTTEQVAAVDISACRTRAARDGYASGIYGQIAGYDYVHRCMADLGYHASLY